MRTKLFGQTLHKLHLFHEFYDESEETSDLIEERLAKTINTSLRANISESKFKETKSKFKRSHKCQNPLIPTVNYANS
jgi:hypothetical protein